MLLHRILGTFVEDCENHVPTKEDRRLALDLRYNMSKLFETEPDRVKAFHRVLEDHSIAAPASLMRVQTKDRSTLLIGTSKKEDSVSSLIPK